MRKLFIYLRDYRKETVLAPLFKLLEATLELFVPLVVAAVIDNGIAGRDAGYIIKMCLFLVLLGAVGLAFSVTAQFFAAKAAAGFVKKIRYALFSHIQKFSYAQLDEQGTSTLITRMTSDMNQVQAGLNLTLRLLLRSPFVVIGAMVMAFAIDVRAALVFAVGIPALAVVVFGIMFVSIPMYRRVQERLDGVLRLTRENLTGVRVLRAFCREEEQCERFREKNQQLTDIQKYVGKISALINPVTYVIINTAIIALIRTGAVRVELGILTQGAVVALYNYMAQILTELVKLANLIISITRAVACGNRIEAVLETPHAGTESGSNRQAQTEKGLARRRGALEACETRQAQTERKPREPKAEQTSETRRRVSHERQNEMPDVRQREASEERQCIAGKKAEYAVEFRDAAMAYPGASGEAIEGISFAVRRGETIGVIGGTGAGKTSLVNLIPRFYECSRGAVLVDGTDVADYPAGELRKKIGVAPQRAVLFQGTIRENLRWGKEDATEEEMLAALAVAQAREIVDGKENGLDAQVEQGGRNFSGGQRQRLTIARALVRKPEILILDDSFSALDPATDAALRRAISHMENRPTLFIVSQRTTAIQNADRILVLEDGEVVGIGTHEELLASCEIYREIYESQYQSPGEQKEASA